MQVKEEAEAQAGLPGRAGPWGVSDGKRLWQKLQRTYDLEYPEAGQHLQPAVTFLAADHYTVDLGEDGGGVVEVKSVRCVEKDGR